MNKLNKEKRSYSDIIKELELSDQIIERYKQLIHSIPECPVHGNECIPHAIEWVNESISIRAKYEASSLGCQVDTPLIDDPSIGM